MAKKNSLTPEQKNNIARVWLAEKIKPYGIDLTNYEVYITKIDMPAWMGYVDRYSGITWNPVAIRANFGTAVILVDEVTFDDKTGKIVQYGHIYLGE